MLYSKFRRLIKPAALILILTSGVCLNAMAGGETYSIYLNKTLLFTRHVYGKNQLDIKTLELGKANYNDQLLIYYYGCGTEAKGRSIVIKDNNGKTLKKWVFADRTQGGAMVIQVREILALEKNKEVAKASLYYYSSNTLPKGRMLAPVALQDDKKSVTSRDSDTNNDWPMWAVRILAFSVFSWIGMRS